MIQSMIEVIVGDRKILVTMNMANLIADAKARLAVKSARISQELAEARLLPHTRGNQFAGWISTCTRLHEAESSVR